MDGKFSCIRLIAPILRHSDFYQFWFLQNFDSDAGPVSMMDAKIVIIFRLKTLQ